MYKRKNVVGNCCDKPYFICTHTAGDDDGHRNQAYVQGTRDDVGGNAQGTCDDVGGNVQESRDDVGGNVQETRDDVSGFARVKPSSGVKHYIVLIWHYNTRI